MRFRAATLNLEQDHKRWEARRELVAAALGALAPDILALNEVCIPLQSARWLQRVARERYGLDYALVQQTKSNALADVEGEALLTRFPILETGNLDYRTLDIVALVARLRIGDSAVDVYVTHLYKSNGDDSLRLFQVQRLLAWIDGRDDADGAIACGDFNAPLSRASAALMATRFRPTQHAPTAPTALAGSDGVVSHPGTARMRHCIDYVWVAPPVELVASGTCFDQPSATDPTLWPSDHVGVWADLELR